MPAGSAGGSGASMFDFHDDEIEAALSPQAAYSRRKTAEKQDIGKLPMIADIDRRLRCKFSLAEHLKTYKPRIFDKPWAGYQLELIAAIENAMWHGRWAAFAVPRGGGKSAICRGATEWGTLHAHIRFPALLAATVPKANKLAKSIKTALRTNKLYREDFPEVCYPIFKLGRSARKCEGQTHLGEHTAIAWNTSEAIYPTIYMPYSVPELGLEKDQEAPTSGSRFATAGILGDIRGIGEETETGDDFRPDFGLVDDFQTRESAKSRPQTQSRIDTITGDVGYLNGPDDLMAVVVPCTVIYQGDGADQLLDREAHPEFHGIRRKMLETEPTNEKLWQEYAEIKKEDQREDKDSTRADIFYFANQTAMDEGAKPTWPQRHPGALSAIQYAMDLKIKNERAFYAEAQNDPRAGVAEHTIKCDTESIMTKQSHLGRYGLPLRTEHVAAHIDPGGEVIHYAVVAASKKFEATAPDYGSYPDQQRDYFTKQDLTNTLSDTFAGEQRDDVKLYDGLTKCIDRIANLPLRREDGVMMDVEKILIDSRYNTDVVNQVCRESPYSAILLAVQGIGVRAKDIPFSERKIPDAVTAGHHFQLYPTPGTKGQQRYMRNDVYYWKTQVHKLFNSVHAPGEASLNLYRATPSVHRMLAEHCNGQRVDRIIHDETGREIDEWTDYPNRPDVDYFDNLVGAFAGLSLLGCDIPKSGTVAAPVVTKKKRRRIKAPRRRAG